MLGSQEFFADRALQSAARSWRDDGAQVRHIDASTEGLLAELLSAASPDLFGGVPAIVLRGFETLSESDAMAVADLIESSDPTCWAIHHAGGRGSTKARARLESVADRTVKVEPLKGRAVAEFVQREFTAHGKTTDSGTVALLVDAVGADPRGLASAAAQLSSDIEERHVSREAAAAYYSGHAEIKGFQVADAVADRDAPRALESLRFAFREGGTGAALMIVGALSPTLRRLAVAKGARPATAAADVAAALRIPEWIARGAVAQSRKWQAGEIAAAVAVLSDLTVELKGGFVAEGSLSEEQKQYLVERALLRMIAGQN